MDSELAAKLNRRLEICGEEIPPTEAPAPQPSTLRRPFSIYHLYAEFRDFTTQTIRKYLAIFKEYDINHDNVLDVNELRVMMEKLGVAQTHLALKEMIREVDEDRDGKVSFREFLLIFRKVRSELDDEQLRSRSSLSALHVLYEQIHEIDVGQHGVRAAADFFDKKAAIVNGNEMVDESGGQIMADPSGKHRVQFNEIRKKFSNGSKAAGDI